MTAFRYRAVGADGRDIEGILDADTQRQVRAQLRERGLFPVNVTPIVHSGDNTPVHRRLRLSNAELALLTRQWSTLLAAGLTLEQTLSATIEQADRPAIRELIIAIRTDIAAGHALSDALQRFADVFPTIYRALVRSGEKSGEIEQILSRLADYLENSHALRQKILQAMIYPMLVTLVAIAVIGGMMTFVVPHVVGAFRQGKQALPWLTRALLGVSDFLQLAWPWLLVLVSIAIAACMYLLRHEAPRRKFHRLLLCIPVLGRLMRTLDAARFAQTLAILVGGGVPLLSALEAGRDTLTLTPLRDSIGMAITRVREGSGLARALAQDKQLPPLLLHMIASGEASGDLPELLERAALQQRNEVGHRTALLVGIVEPIMVVLMGFIVLLIVLAILQPIIEINQLVR